MQLLFQYRPEDTGVHGVPNRIRKKFSSGTRPNVDSAISLSTLGQVYCLSVADQTTLKNL